MLLSLKRIKDMNLLRRTLLTQHTLSISACRKTAFAVIALSIVFVCSGRASATQLYATSISGSEIYHVDTVANTVTPYLNTQYPADSVMFDTSQNVIYTRLTIGEVRLYNPNSSTDSLIASGFSGPADITLEPGGGTMLL